MRGWPPSSALLRILLGLKVAPKEQDNAGEPLHQEYGCPTMVLVEIEAIVGVGEMVEHMNTRANYCHRY